MSTPTINTTGQGVAELQYGRYANTVTFSPITVCTTVTCVLSRGNRLLCGHFSLFEQTVDYDAVLTGMQRLMGSDTVVGMYLVRVKAIWGKSGPHYQGAKPGSYDGEGYGADCEDRFKAANQATTFSQAFGFNGTVYEHETNGDGEVVSAQYLQNGTFQLSVNSAPLMQHPYQAPVSAGDAILNKMKTILKKAFPCFG